MVPQTPLELRVQRLERDCRRLKLVASLPALALLSVLCIGAAVPPPIERLVRARQVDILDDAGATVLTLAADKRGALVAKDRAGTVRLSLGVTEHGPGLVLFNNDGGKSVVLSAGAAGQGGGVLTFVGKDGTARAHLLSSNSGSFLALFGKEGKTGVMATTAEPMGPYLGIGDSGPAGTLIEITAGSRDANMTCYSRGQCRANIRVGRDGVSRAVFRGADGKSSAALGVVQKDSNTAPTLALSDRGEKPRFVAVLDPDHGNPTVSCLSKDGKGLWSAP